MSGLIFLKLNREIEKLLNNTPLDAEEKIQCLTKMIEKICQDEGIKKSIVASDFVYNILRNENGDN